MKPSTLRIAWRNLSRNRKRTALAMAAIALGQVTLVFVNCMQAGMYENMLDTITGPLVGHVQVHAAGWREERALDLCVERLSEVDSAIRALPGVRSVTPRVYAPALAIMGEKTSAPPLPLPPLVVDADGLNILSGWPDWHERLPPGTVLTPHPGEMARLMGCSTREVQEDRVEVARRQARAWGHVVVLKGAYTVVAAPDGRVVLEPFANPGLATGGTGDVLAGIIVALRAQGLPPFEAAVAGAYLHGLAGELARVDLGEAGMAAGDLLRYLPQAQRRLGG